MGKKLVAYFSASGVTAKLAQNVAKVVEGDLHEIQPEQPYSSADLDWTDPKSRSSIEMKDKAFRPSIANRVENMEQYDLSGKTVVPFATSGSSGMGDTNDELKGSCPGAVLKDGKRFSANAGESEIKAWTESLGL